MKKINKKYILFALMLTSIFAAAAQTPEYICARRFGNKDVKGFYITATDFSAGKLTFASDLQHKDDEIKLNQFFNKPYIENVENGKRTRYAKDTIFCVNLHDGRNYRFFEKKPYLIADTSFLFIYVRKEYRTSNRRKGRRLVPKTTVVASYLFSAAGDDNVVPLTWENFLKFLVDNSNRYKMPPALPKSLTDYDEQKKRYKINDILLLNR